MDLFAILFAFCCSTAYPNCTWHVKISDNNHYALININMSNKNTKCKIWVNRLLRLVIYKHISWRSFTSNCHQSSQLKKRIICFLSRCHTSNWYLTWYISIPPTTFRTHLMTIKKTTRDCLLSLRQMRRIVHILSCCHTSDWYLARHVSTPTRTCKYLLSILIYLKLFHIYYHF